MNVLLLPTSIILKEILETGDLANNIVKNSSTENYSDKFKRRKIKAEHTALMSIQIAWKITIHHLKWENWWTP